MGNGNTGSGKLGKGKDGNGSGSPGISWGAARTGMATARIANA